MIALLLADDEPSVRLSLAARAGDSVDGLTVLQAEDGAQAVEIARAHRPGLALLDVRMPVLGGIEAAVALREVRPHMRVALTAGDPFEHHDRARELRLPLFDKADIDRTLRWVELQARALVERQPRAASRTLSLECSVCGYGAALAAPPERCPMCQGEGTWLQTRRSPFGAAAARTVGGPMPASLP